MIGLDFALGIAATLSAEFLVAHAYLWYGSGGSNTVSSVVSTAERDLSQFKSVAVGTEQKVISAVKAVGSSIRAEEQKIEQFGKNIFHGSPPPPPPAAPATPQTGGTPVPSVVMSAPAS